MKSLTGSAASGARWTGASAAWMLVLRLAQTAVLARLLAPHLFGLMAMANSVLGLAQTFADAGMSAALIHRQEADPGKLSSLFWTNVLLGGLLFGLVCASAPLVAAFFGQPELVPVTIASAAVFLISPFGTVYRLLLQKDLRFRALSTIEMAAELVGVAVAIVTAFRGWGVYALVAGWVARELVVTLLLVANGARSWRPSLRLRKADLEGYLGFGMFQLGERTLNYLSWNADKILLGRLLGASALGYYQISWNLALRPLTGINQIVHRVAFPLFSKIQSDDERLTRGYLRVLRAVAFVNFPVYLGMFAVASPLIAVYLGPGWEPAAEILRILAFVGLMHSLGNPVGSLLLAKGRADIGFWMNLVVFLFTLPAIYVGSHWGAPGIAAAILIAEVALFYPIEAWVRWIAVRMPLLAATRAVLPFLALAGAMALVVLAADGLSTFPSDAVRVVSLIAVGAGCYAALAFCFERGFLRELSALAKVRG